MEETIVTYDSDSLRNVLEARYGDLSALIAVLDTEAKRVYLYLAAAPEVRLVGSMLLNEIYISTRDGGYEIDGPAGHVLNVDFCMDVIWKKKSKGVDRNDE